MQYKSYTNFIINYYQLTTVKPLSMKQLKCYASSKKTKERTFDKISLYAACFTR